jgi:serine protease
VRLRPLIVCSMVLALLPAAPAFADDPAPSPSVSQTSPPPSGTPEEKLQDGLALGGGETTRAIVELSGPAQDAAVASAVASKAAADSVDVVLQPRTLPFMVVEGTAAELAALAEDPRVTSIHRDRAYPPSATPAIQLIGADQAHAKGFTGSGQAVAVLDTGVDTDHPYLGGRVVGEACFSSVSEGVQSLCPNGGEKQTGPGSASATTATCLAGGVNLCDHGTHVAGIAAGADGVAPGAGIVAIQVFSRIDDEETCGEPSCLLAFESSLRLAMEYVQTLTTPIAAVNLSLGGLLSETSCDDTEEGQVFKPQIDALLAKGIATVVAAGNEYFEGTSFPACVSTAVAVGANDGDDRIADFSNRGALVDLFAPGVDINSSVPDNQMAVYSGTSMAAPHVAGALALMKAASPETPIQELIDKLKSTGRPYTYQANGTDVTTPRLDLAAALAGAAQQPPVSQSPPVGGDEPDPSEPTPYDGSGPTPTADPTADPTPTEQQPSPIPLPTVTVTVTVTATPPAPVCTRGTKAKRMTAKQWAVEIHRNTGKIPDATLTCYLRLVQKASKVFPEITKASTLGTAYRVLKADKTTRQRLDGALLVGWLNWTYGTNGTSTLNTAEKIRLAAKSSSTALKKATANVLKAR